VLRIKPTPLELVALAAAACIISFQLFIHPILGVADNGDFFRVTGLVGLEHASVNYEDKFFNYVDTYTWSPSYYAGWLTTELLMAFPASWLGRLLSGDGLFHVQTIGLIHSIVFLMVLWLLLIQTRELRPWIRTLTAALLVFLLTDVGYVAYFNSFYCEPACFLFVLMTIGFSMVAINRVQSFWPLVAYSVAAVLLIGSKPQTAALGLPLAVFGFYIAFRAESRLKRCIGIAFAVGLLLFSGLYFKRVPKQMTEVTNYLAVFLTMLPNSNDPAADLRYLGLDEELAKYSGVNPFTSEGPLYDPSFKEAFNDRLRPLAVPTFYTTHPGRSLHLLDRSARLFFLERQTDGNYAKSAGQPPHTLNSIGRVWGAARSWLPGSIWFIFGLLLLNCVVAIGDFTPIKAVLLLGLALGSITFVTVAIFGGDFPRTAMVSQTLFDLLLILDIAWIANLRGLPVPARIRSSYAK
jgi:hypothetical protein